MKVWISKYALSTGLFESEAEIDTALDMCTDRSKSFPMYFHGEGREWHRTREGAVERAEVLRENKIASVKKQLAKLEKMKF